jgi:hypothetical protein
MGGSTSIVEKLGTSFLGESTIAATIALAGLVQTLPNNLVGSCRIIGRLEHTNITRLTRKVKLSLL